MVTITNFYFFQLNFFSNFNNLNLNLGVKLVLSGLVDCKNINGGGHKAGLGLEVEA
jgi:hypothetical protein